MPGIRDLRWLLFGLVLAATLHVPHSPLWVGSAVVVLGIWRYLIAHYRLELPRIALLMPLTVLSAIGILITHRGLFGRDASVELLALMLMLKLMEAKTSRDFIILICGGYLLIAAAFLYSQSMLYGAAMLLPTFALTASLVGISYPAGNLRWQVRAKFSAILLVQAVPIMLALFFLFPRVSGPLWGTQQKTQLAVSGLADSMVPGDISDLTVSGDVAFRVVFEGSPPPARHLYWRGPVLWNYDGRTWTMDNDSEDNSIEPIESLSVAGPAVKYTITLEPHNRRSLLLLDMPATLPPQSRVSHDMQALSKEPVESRIRYQASSHFDYTLAARLDRHSIAAALRLPPGGNPQTRALARQWRSAGYAPEAIVEAALKMLHEQKFVYTLRPPALGPQPVDDFLFHTRRGFCEHYSSSFVYLMRAAGVPARIVTGYQGGEMNPVSNYMIVRQSDAHAWAEVWIKDKGWLRIDPTAAASPERVESGIQNAIPEASQLPLSAQGQSTLVKKMYFNLDAVDNAWNQWILDYDEKRQTDLLSRLAGNRLSWVDITIIMIAVVGTVALISAYLLLRETLPNEPLLRTYAIFIRKLKRHGITHHPHEGAVDLGRRAMEKLPDQAAIIRNISNTYVALRYGHSQSHRQKRLTLLKQLVKKFK